MGRNNRRYVQYRTRKYLEDHPLCELCCYVEAICVHHIKPVGMGGAPPESPLHQESNFVALCCSCHLWAHNYPLRSRRLFREKKWAEAGNIETMSGR